MDLSNLPMSSNIDDQRTDIEKLLDNDNFTRAPALWDRLKDEDTMSRPNSRVADSFMSLLPGAQGVPQTQEQLAASKPLAALYDRGGNEKFADIKSLIEAARPFVAEVASKPGAFSSQPTSTALEQLKKAMAGRHEAWLIDHMTTQGQRAQDISDSFHPPIPRLGPFPR